MPVSKLHKLASSSPERASRQKEIPTMTTKTNLAPVNASQAQILAVLAKHKGSGMTTEQIKKKVGEGVAVSPSTIGPVALKFREDYPDSLHSRGLVSVLALDGKENLFSATDKGKEISASTKFRKRTKDTDRIPGEVLDAAVLAVRAKKTYGLELYTNEDLEEIRKLLPEEFSAVRSDYLRNQITNQRKKGAYADKLSKTKRAIESALRYFGPEGKLIPGLLSPSQMQKMRALLAG